MQSLSENEFLRRVKVASGALLAVVAFIMSLTEFIDFVKGNQKLSGTVIFSVSFTLIFTFLLYIYRKKKRSDLVLSYAQEMPVYPKIIRQGALLGMIILPSIIILGVGYKYWPETNEDESIKILITKFEREDQEEDLFSTRILEALEENLGGDFEVAF